MATCPPNLGPMTDPPPGPSHRQPGRWGGRYQQPSYTTATNTINSTDNDRGNSGKPNLKVHLKKIDSDKNINKEDVFQVAFAKLNAPLTKLVDTKTGLFAYTDNQSSVDSLLSKKAISLFAKINLKPSIPPEVRAKRTIFVRQVDDTVGRRTANDIKDELTAKQNWIKIEEIIKIKHFTHIFKIVCENVETADKILDQGLLLFNTKISKFQCEREEYTHLLICFKCYQYETHPTKDCTSTTTYCSECGLTGHDFRQCASDNKKCLNCGGDHRTLAVKCPIRKQKQLEKQQKEKQDLAEKQNKTYREIVKKTVQETKAATTTTQINLTNDTHLKMTALILEAHIASLTRPGTYAKNLSELMKLNFDLDVKFPDRNSQEIFDLFMKKDQNKQTQKEHNENAQTDIYQDDDDFQRSPHLQHSTPTKNRFAAFTDDEIMETEETEDETRTGQKTRQKTKKKTQPQFKIPAIPSSTKRQLTSPEEGIPAKQAKEQENVSSQDESVNLSKVQSPNTLRKNLATTPASYGIRIYKSKLDRSIIPYRASPEYFYKMLTQKDFGLKLAYESGDLDTIMTNIKDGTIRLTEKNIIHVEHDTFQRLARTALRKPIDTRLSTSTRWSGS